MNQDVKKRYDELKQRNEEKFKKLSWKNNILLQECLTALAEDSLIIKTEESNHILDMFYRKVPLSKYSRITWENIHYSKCISNPSELLEQVKSKEFYIIWNELNLPIVKSTFDNIISYIDDVTAVSFDTWLLSISFNEVIEFYHEGEITFGIID